MFAIDKVSLSLAVGGFCMLDYVMWRAARRQRPDVARAIEVFLSSIALLGAFFMVKVFMFPSPGLLALSENAEVRIALAVGAITVTWLSVTTILKSFVS